MMGRIIIWSSLVLLPLFGLAQWSQPGDRWAFEFDGSASKIELANESLFDFSTSVTLEFDVWFDNVTTGAWQGIIAKRESGGLTTFGLNINGSTNAFQWYLNGSGTYKIHTLTLRTYFSAGQWYHLKLSFTESGSDVNSSIIIDGGTPLTTTLTSVGINGNTAPVTFGVSHGTSEYFGGKLDNVKIIGDGKTISYHKLDDGSGTTSTDRFGNADGTITVGNGGWYDKWTPPFSPLNYDNLVVWLEANDPDGDDNPANNTGDYSTWADKSGNGNDFTQYSGWGSPTYGTGGLNGNAYLDFANDLLESGAIAILNTVEEYTIFVVADADFSGKNLMSSKGSTFFGGIAWGVTNATSFWQWAVRNASTSGSNTLAGTTSDPFLGVYVWNDSDIAWFRVNGSTSTNITGRNVTPTAHSNIFLGAFDQDDIYSPWDGKVYEVLIYGTTLSSGDIADIEDYLSTKYGL